MSGGIGSERDPDEDTRQKKKQKTRAERFRAFCFTLNFGGRQCDEKTNPNAIADAIKYGDHQCDVWKATPLIRCVKSHLPSQTVHPCVV